MGADGEQSHLRIASVSDGGEIVQTRTRCAVGFRQTVDRHGTSAIPRSSPSMAMAAVVDDVFVDLAGRSSHVELFRARTLPVGLFS
jgi:hypothetical protein